MRRVLALAVLLCAVAATPDAARGGVFEVSSCASGDTTAFAAVNQNASTMTTATQCPPTAGTLLSGIYAASRTNTSTPDGAWSGWTIAAPTGLTIQRLDVARSIGTRRDFWRAVVRTDEGRLLEVCELGELLECRRGDPGTNAAMSYPNLNTRGVTFAIECHTVPAGLTCPGRSQTQAWAAVYGATAVVEDPTPPAVEPVRGPLVDGRWNSGVQLLEVAASDLSGIKSLSVVAGQTKLADKQPPCDYARMQPCPSGVRESFAVDTSRLDDGTYDLKVIATDAADQAGTAAAVLKVDRHAPAAPIGLAATAGADGTIGLTWSNPEQGTAAPIVAAHYEICDADGAGCSATMRSAGPAIARVGGMPRPAGVHLIRIWLEDAAGNLDRANAASLIVDPSAVGSIRAVELNPPILDAGPAPPALRVASARRRGATLTLSGTIARAATARITARVSRQRASSTMASGRAYPKRGRWSVRIRLPSALRRSSSFYVSLSFAGEKAFSASTIRRRLTEKTPRAGSVSEEFSLERRG